MSFVDDVLGFDPNGGGIWDQDTGLLGNTPTWLQQPIQNAVTNAFNPSQTGGQQSYFDQFGDIDVTAPGVTTNVQGSAADVARQGYINPTLQAAENLYNAGAVQLNPLQEAYYNQVAGLTQPDAYGQQLAQEAAQATSGAFGSAGTLGSARNYQAANNAAAKVIEDRAMQRRNELNQAGQQYYNWQDTADWNNLNRFQEAINAAPSGQTTGTTTAGLTGAEIYNTSIGKELVQKYGPEALLWLQGGNVGGINTGNAGVSQGSAQQSSSNPIEAAIGGAVGGVVGDVFGDVASSAVDWISDWF